MLRRLSFVSAAVIAIAAASGCGICVAVPPDVAWRKASSDFSCDELTLEHVVGGNWKASGCGKTASYLCWQSAGMKEGSCMREGAMP
jgi:hypothetical protein